MSVDSIVNVVAGRIGDLLVQEAKLLYGVDVQVRSLQRELTMMNSFLQDTEDMDEEGGDRLTHTMINEIRKIAYDAEDVIEFYILESSSLSSKKESFFKRYACFCSNLVLSHQVGSEIEEIRARIAETMESWKKYRGENGGKRNVGEVVKRTKISSYPRNIEEHVVGLEEDISKLVDVLTKVGNLNVVSIVGMGGSGKTTLARKLFNKESLKTHFDFMAWVSISQQWETHKILVELLSKASPETVKMDESLSLDEIEEKLQQYCKTKRCLIILDDVWEKKAIQEILPTFQSSANVGSKIIVTTRKREVFDFPDLKCFFHEPRRLSEEESWELFRNIALIHKEENSSDSVSFEILASKVLKKCGGLPSAVIALAGILVKKKSIEDWEKVNRAVSSRIVEEGSGTLLYGPVKEMLILSYNDLPRELKPCFLYLATFPEDAEISKGMLCKMWIAEGFITSDQLQDGDTVEDVAMQYLDELINRCVVQIAKRNYEGNVKAIQIHDLVRDLCIKKAKEQYFLETISSNSSNADATELRRAAAYSYDRPIPTKSQHLRTIYLALGVHTYIDQKPGLQILHEDFRLLRVLYLEGIQTVANRDRDVDSPEVPSFIQYNCPPTTFLYWKLAQPINTRLQIRED